MLPNTITDKIVPDQPAPGGAVCFQEQAGQWDYILIPLQIIY